MDSKPNKFVQSILDKAQKIAIAKSGDLKYHYICHVCGYNGEESYYENEGKLFGTQNICPCCNVQHGYGDDGFDSVNTYRNHWLTVMQGAFNTKELEPINWDREIQMKNIPPQWL